MTSCAADAPPQEGTFIGGAWPIGRSALAALVDLGLSDEIIAHYFMIEPCSVAALREHYQVGRVASASGECN
ncbi:hypothetical protein KXR53_26390 [Inquilinus limosus]|uniref:hypothetical protein n=1 Tax=Inquilinus limosus TaxID=171674 RepID=UPI003F14A75E